MRRMNLVAYISGPITGLHNNNWDSFNLAQTLLEDMGYEVINPHNLEPNINHELEAILTKEQWEEYVWRCYMNVCLPEVGRSHVVYTLKGVENSRGGQIEVRIAKDYHIPVLNIGERMMPEVFQSYYSIVPVEYP